MYVCFTPNKDNVKHTKTVDAVLFALGQYTVCYRHS